MCSDIVMFSGFIKFKNSEKGIISPSLCHTESFDDLVPMPNKVPTVDSLCFVLDR